MRAYLPYLAWAQALIATTGSLFVSEVLALTPCVLCWYQRILMYPLVVILAVGILELFGFVTIPLMSLTAFAVITMTLMAQGAGRRPSTPSYRATV